MSLKPQCHRGPLHHRPLPCWTLEGAFRVPFRYVFVFFRILSRCYAFFCTLCGSSAVFLCFFSSLLIFWCFFFVFELPRALPDPKKPLKSLYCRQISKVHQIGQSYFLRPLWGASGTTFGVIFGTLGTLGALLGGTWGPKGRWKLQKSVKKRGPESGFTCFGALGVPKCCPGVPTASKMAPPGSNKATYIVIKPTSAAVWAKPTWITRKDV